MRKKESQSYKLYLATALDILGEAYGRRKGKHIHEIRQDLYVKAGSIVGQFQ